MPTVAQIFAHTLKEIGVKYVFGVPSGNMIDYVEAICNEEDIEFILVGHESAAALMAAVCGRITGVPGVCFATFGPGATNLSTGVGSAFLDRDPLIAFSDEMPDHLLGRIAQMNINHQQLFFPITKWTTRLVVSSVEEIILKGAGLANEETPGSVHIGIPAGIGMEEILHSEARVDYLRIEKKRWSPLVADQLVKIEKLWMVSQNPVLAVGLSAARAGVKDLIIEIAEKHQLPVVLTPMAKGMFPESHPLYSGVLFHALSDIVAQVYSKADLILGVGYDPVELNYENWMPEIPLIHMDSKPADIDNEKIPEVLNIVGNLENTLKELLKTETPSKNWNPEFLKENKNELIQKLTPEPGSFGPLTVVSELRKALPENGILSVDVGAHLHLIGQYWTTPEPGKLLMTNGWSGMGYAIPAAMAAKLCYPELPVVAVMGDGGFLMMVGELATAKRLNLKIVFIVICDNSLSLIRIKQEKKNYHSNYGTDLEIHALEPTNHYFGVPVLRATNKQSFVDSLSEAFNFEGSVVIEAVVEGSEYNELVLNANK